MLLWRNDHAKNHKIPHSLNVQTAVASVLGTATVTHESLCCAAVQLPTAKKAPQAQHRLALCKRRAAARAAARAVAAAAHCALLSRLGGPLFGDEAYGL